MEPKGHSKSYADHRKLFNLRFSMIMLDTPW